MNCPTFDNIIDNTWNNDTPKEALLHAPSKISSKGKIQKHMVNRNGSERNQLQNRLINAGSFENYIEPVYNEKDSVAKQTNT